MNRFRDRFFAFVLVALCVPGVAMAEGVLAEATATAADAAADVASDAVDSVSGAASDAVTAMSEVAATAPADAADAPGQMSESDAMAAFIAAGAPGEQHAVLASLAGTFNAEVTHQMAPGAPAQTSQGMEVSTMILGGRFLQSSYEGEAMGMPFQGLGTLGYDNLTEQYVSTWMDSMGTNIMVARGTAGNDANVLNLSVEPFMCPMTGTAKSGRQVTTIHDANHHTFQWYEVLPDGNEFLAMTIKYTRAPEAPEAP